MKRFLVLFMACLFLFASMVPMACGGQYDVTFEWEQPGDVSDLAGWRLWVSDTAGGPYDDGATYFQDINGNPLDFIEIPYSGTPSTTYTADNVIIIVPDGAETTLCFVVNAWDVDDNFSANSNEHCEPFDFLSPGVPYNFRVRVKTRGN